MASGNTLLIFTPLGNEPPATNYATLDTVNSHPVLNFDDTTAEAAIWSGTMPRAYAGGGVTVYIHWGAYSTTGDCDWDVSWERIADQVLDIDADSFAAVNSVDGTAVPATIGFIDIASVAFTDGADMDSVAAGEAFRLRVQRGAPTDTEVGDCYILAVEVKET